MAKAARTQLIKAVSPIASSAQAAQKKPTSAKKKPSLRGESAAPTPLTTSVAETFKSAFPIVGIGASAGGLEAVQAFLSGVPVNSGIAFVVVQHLDPNHKGMLVELLQRVTPIPVQQITEVVTVQPNHIYVIPPGFDLSILHGVLHLLEPTSQRGLRLPINYFLCSLAADQKERSVGVILSGMGSDGTLGLRAIKEQAGATFVQSADSAKFEGMPLSAINAGLADVVAPAEQLAAKIISYLHHVPLLPMPFDVAVADADQSGLGKVLVLLRAQTGHDFSLYKKSTIYRRIERRMALHQLKKIADYVRVLRGNPQEIDLLFKELLIGVTSFFRDPAVWEQLTHEVIPSLLTAYPKGVTLRAWVPACSTGEEAYTLAIVFRESMKKISPEAHFELQVFATDLDSVAIEKARVGVYPTTISADVPEALLRRYFVHDEGAYRVGKEVREMVIFAPQNLVMDPPFTKLDILTCRNLLIYLEKDLQAKLLPLFHYSLNPNGVLILGCSETVAAATDLFAPLPGNNRIYSRLSTRLNPARVQLPSALAERPVTKQRGSQLLTTLLSEVSMPNLRTLTESVLLKHFAPVAVLTTAAGDIVYIRGKTGHYLEPAAGKVNHNLLAMARKGLAAPLNEALGRLQRLGEPVELRSIKVGTNGGTQLVNVDLHPLTEPAALSGMVLVVFTDVPIPPMPTQRLRKGQWAKDHTEQLGSLEHQLNVSREEMQISQEELKSTNEELQSTNEELQSANEELTTSKEEMQSMNEELQTVNHELTVKIEELSRASDDMNNLLNSTHIATLFLNDELKVRRYTTQTTHLFKLIASDVGRPITDLVSILDYPTLADDAREVLRSLVFHESQVKAKEGRTFMVRTMPYRTQDNRIDGVVITFIEITVATQALQAQKESQAMLQAAMDCSPTGILIADAPHGTLRYVNRAGLLIRGEGVERAVNGVDINTFVSAWQLVDFAGVPLATDQTPLARAIRHGETIQRDFMIRRPSQEERSVSASAVPILDDEGVVTAAVVVLDDITERLRVEAVLREALDVLKQRFTLQSSELDAARVIEQALNKAQTVLEKRFASQGNALQEARSDLQSEKKLHHGPNNRNHNHDAV